MISKRLFGIDLANNGDLEGAEQLMVSAFNDGDISAMNDYGVIAERKGDYWIAKNCYQTAAILGSGMAVVNLGNLYQYGRGVQKNHNIACMLYQRGVQLKETRAFSKLARMLTDGENIEHDPKRALQVLLDGYEIEKKSSFDYDCAIELACGYSFGKFGEVNLDKALEYYKVAADKGCVLALYNGGCAYKEKGEIEKAIDCWMKAGKHGYGDAYAELHDIYWEGTDKIKQDKDMAAAFLRKAQMQNSGMAFIRTADMWLSGDWGEVNKEKAKQAIVNYFTKTTYPEDYMAFYEEIKKCHENDLDWEEIEKSVSDDSEYETDDEELFIS